MRMCRRELTTAPPPRVVSYEGFRFRAPHFAAFSTQGSVWRSRAPGRPSRGPCVFFRFPATVDTSGRLPCSFAGLRMCLSGHRFFMRFLAPMLNRWELRSWSLRTGILSGRTPLLDAWHVRYGACATGSSGDSPMLLEKILRQKTPNALVVLCDPKVAAECSAAGVGSAVSCHVGKSRVISMATPSRFKAGCERCRTGCFSNHGQGTAGAARTIKD